MKPLRALFRSGSPEQPDLSDCPLQARYQRCLQQGYREDPAQRAALAHLTALQQSLRDPGFRSAGGLYIWGPVGRGKTFLMDLFCQSMRDDLQQDVLRLHFHRFMAMLHKRLLELKGQEDPLALIADELAQQHRVLCFDELLVSEIGDAMLLGRLIEHLFARRMLLVCTTNREPETLYRGDIHRDRFEPCVKLINQHMQVVSLLGELDHRERPLTPAISCVLNASADALLPYWQTRTDQSPADGELNLRGRMLNHRGLNGQVIWFDFTDLCEGPRSHLDYVELAQRFDTVFLSDVPALGAAAQEQIKARGTEDGAIGSGSTGERRVLAGRSEDAARRFIALIDELYDRQVNLFWQTEIPMHSLYQGNLMQFEFQRTCSRLTEMASLEYQQRPHQP